MFRPIHSPVAWTALVLALLFCAQGIGYGICLASGLLPSTPYAWLCFALSALVVGSVAIWLLQRFALEPLRAQAADAAESIKLSAQSAEKALQQRQTRHDLRGALSPALLSADRLLSHADPAVKRSGEIIARSVERAITLLNDPPSEPRVNPPAG